MSVVLLRLDRELAVHLALAVRRYAADLAAAGHPRPAGLADIEALFTAEATTPETVRSSQEQSQAVTVRTPPQRDLHVREWLSPAEVAEVTSLSITTVRRRIRDGSLPSRLVGRRRLVPRAAVDHPMKEKA